jgi:MFS family permease
MPRAEREHREVDAIRRLLLEYASIAREHPRVLAICVASIGSCVPVYFFQVVAVSYAMHLGQQPSFVSILYAFGAAGGIAGGLVAGWRQFSPRVAAVPLVASILLFGALSLTNMAIVALGILVVSNALDVIGEVVFDTLLQSLLPDRLQGRAFGMLYWFFAIGQMVGAGAVAALSTGQAVLDLLPVALLSLLPLAAGLYIWALVPRAAVCEPQLQPA